MKLRWPWCRLVFRRNACVWGNGIVVVGLFMDMVCFELEPNLIISNWLILWRGRQVDLWPCLSDSIHIGSGYFTVARKISSVLSISNHVTFPASEHVPKDLLPASPHRPVPLSPSRHFFWLPSSTLKQSKSFWYKNLQQKI